MSFTLVTRAEWGARRPKARASIHASEPTTIHWNGPKVPERDHSRCAALVRGIQNFHMDGRGWSDIAYNFMVCRHGHVFEGRGTSARGGANGQAAWNKVSYAVMYLGGEGNPFTPEAQKAIAAVVAWLAKTTPAPKHVKGHRDWKRTACPGDEIYRWVRAGTPVPEEDDTLYIFKTAEEARPFVIGAYLRVAGREVESEKTRETWVYSVVVDPKSALDLITALHKEHLVRHENEIAKLKKSLGDGDCKVLSEKEILATVAKALENG